MRRSNRTDGNSRGGNNSFLIPIPPDFPGPRRSVSYNGDERGGYKRKRSSRELRDIEGPAMS